jgi:hypothetical protein
MFRITPDQVEIMRYNRMEAFCKRAIAFAREEVPRTKDMDDEDLRGALDRTVREAEAVDIRSEQGIVMLYCAVLLCWKDIFALPEVQNILQQTHRSEKERIEAVIGVL